MRNGIFFTVCVAAVFVLTTLSVCGLDINVDTTWSTDQTFSESVLVSPGVTLTINPGVTVSFTRSGGPYKLGMFPGSIIIAEGTESNPIVFTSAESSPQPGDWQGFWLSSGSTGTIDYIISEYADDGIWTETGIDITNSVLRYTSESGIECKGSGVIDNCHIHDTGTSGLYIASGAAPIVSNTILENNGNHGILISSNAGLPNLGIHNDPDSPGNNTYRNSTNYDVYNDLSTQVKAEWSNWNEGSAAKIYGNVDIDPRQDEAAVEDASLGEVKATFK